MSNKREVVKMDAVQLGKFLAVMYGMLGVLLVPFALISMIFSSDGAGWGFLFMLGMWLFYIVAGFIGGLLMGFVYNLAAKWVGGIKVEVADAD